MCVIYWRERVSKVVYLAKAGSPTEGWRTSFKVDPIPTLLASDNAALASLVRRDLVGEEAQPLELLWQMPQVERLLRKQRSNGAWKYPGGGKVRSQEDYDQLETFRTLGHLIEQYGLNRHHPAIRQAADFIFSHQTSEGDFRGIYGNQYSPNYSAAIMELLVKAGYENDLLDRWLYQATSGRRVAMGRPLGPLLLLTTTGRRTGMERTTPVFYLRDGKRLVVCNVNPGFERANPWTLNLRANPTAQVQIGKVHGVYQAREASQAGLIATGRTWWQCGQLIRHSTTGVDSGLSLC